MAKDRQHRGFTYHYDLGTVKVSKPDAEGGLFKNRERVEKIVLRELVYVAYPETKSNPESSRRIAEDIVARTRR